MISRMKGHKTLDLTEAAMDLEGYFLAVDKPSAFALLDRLTDTSTGTEIVDDVIMPALESIGDRWEKGQVSLSQVYMSGKIAEAMVDKVILSTGHQADSGGSVAVAVLEDHHNLGKRILASVLSTSGMQVMDYGHALSVDELVSMVERDGVDYLMISTLMLPAALRVKDAMIQIKERSPHTKVIVGGAPYIFDPALGEEVGAHAVGRTATESLNILKRMMREGA